MGEHFDEIEQCDLGCQPGRHDDDCAVTLSAEVTEPRLKYRSDAVLDQHVVDAVARWLEPGEWWGYIESPAEERRAGAVRERAHDLLNVVKGAVEEGF